LAELFKGDSMKAAFYTSQGPAREVLRIGELPDPHPGQGEVRVRIRASGVNPTDTYTRSGVRRRGMPFETIVPNQDGAGEIDEVGEGVVRRRIGERVYVTMAQWQRPWGTASEYVALPEERAIALPERTSFEQGACLGVPILTAHYALALYGGVAGQTVLVQGGAGAVGFYAIQFAKLAGATVIATVSGDQKAQVARSAGADHVINYRTEELSSRVAEITAGRGVRRVLEVNFAANSAKIHEVLGKGGTVVVYGSRGPEGTIAATWGIQNQPTIRFIYMYELPAEAYKAAYADLAGWSAAGHVKHLPVKTFPLEEIGAAHEMVERGNDGVRAVVWL
jgi:NADPH2:quinone reductase